MFRFKDEITNACSNWNDGQDVWDIEKETRWFMEQVVDAAYDRDEAEDEMSDADRAWIEGIVREWFTERMAERINEEDGVVPR